MKKISKSIKICFALGILFGLILLFIKLWFQLSEEETMRIYIYLSIALIIISVIINLSYNLFYGRKMNALMPLLGEAKYDEYLDKITAIRDKVKSKHLRAIAELNRTAALTGKKRICYGSGNSEGIGAEGKENAFCRDGEKVESMLELFLFKGLRGSGDSLSR